MRPLIHQISPPFSSPLVPSRPTSVDPTDSHVPALVEASQSNAGFKVQTNPLSLSLVTAMADYGGISLPQGRDLLHTSGDESSDHNPRTVPILLSATAAGHGSSSSSKPKKTRSGASSTACGTEFGSTPEISKKPRGRPPGSKNKPKPPIVITKNCDSAMKPVIIEISAGSDVVGTVIQFAHKRRVGINVLSGYGSVSNVTLRHPVSHTPSLTLHGPFSLLSLSGSCLGYPTATCSTKQLSSSSCLSAVSFPSYSSFGICLAGAQGQVFGGIVGGKVIAASLVVVVVATHMSCPEFHRLPGEADEAEDDREAKPNIDCSGAGGNGSESCTSGNAMSMSVHSVGSPTPLSQIAPEVML